MATVLITGGTGMIGTALSKLLISKGYTVVILTRDTVSARTDGLEGAAYFRWDPSRNTIDADAIRQADYIINLAGANIGAKRWTAKRKKQLVNSRLNSAVTLVRALQQTSNKVKAVIQPSGSDWYPADPVAPNPSPYTEEASHSNDFLGELCLRWEEGIQPVKQLGKRLVILRTGMVLSKGGGALDQFERPVRFGIAPILGSGKQMISWIHLEDICRIYLFALENESLQGVYNAVAPTPVSARTLMTGLAQLICGRFYLPVKVPAFLLRAVLGEMSIAVLKSTTVSSEKIRQAGYRFEYPAIEPALFDIEKK